MQWVLQLWMVLTVLTAIALLVVVAGQAVAARARQVVERLEHGAGVKARPRSV